jgi:hypothetical protein
LPESCSGRGKFALYHSRKLLLHRGKPAAFCAMGDGIPSAKG